MQSCVKSTLELQTGAVLLILMLVLVAGSSYVLVSNLNAAATTSFRQQSTSKTLAEAKQALIGRSISDANRPGSLLCPDTDGDGDAELFAGNACPSYSGWLPWSTLRMTKPVDAAGENLWYVIQPTLRDHTTAEPINSDTAGMLSVDAVNDVVAVIIAPGPALVGQVNRPSNAIGDYLEGENANGDNIFTLNPVNLLEVPNTLGNDSLVYITRQELMGMVEKRVISEINTAMNTYRNSTAPGAFPWLSPFDSPAASAFRGTVNTRQGHIPFHWSGDNDSIIQGGGLMVETHLRQIIPLLMHRSVGILRLMRLFRL